MNSSVRWAGVAFAMLLAAPALAQGTADTTQSRTGSARGRGGVGGMIGGSLFCTSDDYSQGALPRFSFDGHFRYTFSPRLRGQAAVGYTWSAYSKQEPPPYYNPDSPDDVTKEEYLTQLLPFSAELQYLWGKYPRLYHLGVGPGIYRIWVQDNRKVLRDPDPASLELHQNLYVGLTAEVGVEHFLDALPSTSVELTLANHYVFSEDVETFPSGWNTNLGALALHIGVNYYFDLNRPKAETNLPPGVR